MVPPPRVYAGADSPLGAGYRADDSRPGLAAETAVSRGGRERGPICRAGLSMGQRQVRRPA